MARCPKYQTHLQTYFTAPSGRRQIVLALLLVACIPAFRHGLYAQESWPAPSSTFPNVAEPDEAIRHGDAAYDAFDNAAALRAYREAFARDSLRYGLLYRLATAANDLGQDLYSEDMEHSAEARIREAVEYAEMLRTHYSDQSGTWFQLAATYGNLALFSGGRHKVKLGRRVDEYAQRAIRLDSTNANAYLALGIFYREVGELSWLQRVAANTLFGGVPAGGTDKAIEALEIAADLNPDLNMVHYELAKTYLHDDRPEEAIPHLRKAARLPVLSTQEIRNREWARELLTRKLSGEQ